MIIGVAKVDVTPTNIVELSGYAARTQPMTGVLDPINAKAMYLEHAHKKLLWLSLDVLALSHTFVESFRQWARNELNIADILLTATHTHAAPAVVELTGCGRCDAEYLRMLQSRSREAAREAVTQAENAQMVFAQTEFPLAIDRRGKASAHVDSKLSAIGWKRANGEFVAVLVNYPMHPVSLGHVNRQISADWPGGAERAMQSMLPGAPITLITNGACGNLNPPARPVSSDQTEEYGTRVASAIAGKLLAAQPASESLFVSSEYAMLPLEALSPDQIDQIARARINEFENTDWSKTFREAITKWSQTQKELVAFNAGNWIDIELFAVHLGPVVILAISGELFSRFAALLRARISKPLLVVGYANAVFGYIPTAEAYDEGGYEVDQAHFFYNSFRPAKGGLEMLAERAADLIAPVF